MNPDKPLPAVSENSTTSCPFCSSSFATNGGLLAHIHAVHKPSERFKCTDCQYSTASKKMLTFHVKKTHEAEETMPEEPPAKIRPVIPSNDQNTRIPQQKSSHQEPSAKIRPPAPPSKDRDIRIPQQKPGHKEPLGKTRTPVAPSKDQASKASTLGTYSSEKVKQQSPISVEATKAHDDVTALSPGADDRKGGVKINVKSRSKVMIPRTLCWKPKNPLKTRSRSSSSSSSSSASSSSTSSSSSSEDETDKTVAVPVSRIVTGTTSEPDLSLNKVKHYKEKVRYEYNGTRVTTVTKKSTEWFSLRKEQKHEYKQGKN